MIKGIHENDRDYPTRERQWRRARDVFEGEDAVKAGGQRYLAKQASYTGAEYKDYVERAHFLPATERTITMLVGLAFRKDMQTKIPSRMKDQVEQHFKDITLEGEDLGQAAGETVRDILLLGRRGILIEWSETLRRPFWRFIETEDIVQRSFLRLPSGVTALERVVLREWRDDGRIDKRSTEYRIEHRILPVALSGGALRYEYSYQTWRERPAGEYKKDEDKFERFGDPVIPLRIGEPLDRVPFVFVVAAGTGKKMPKPPMLDLINSNLSHFRTSASREEGAYWTSCPTPWITGHKTDGRKPLTVGGRKAWVIPEQEAKVGLLEFTGAGLKSLKEIMDEKRADMAMLGARMLTQEKRAAETAESLRLRSAESSASLSDVVVMVSKALTMAAWLHLWWFYGDADPLDSDVDIAINKEFVDAQIDPQMLTALTAAVQSGKMSYATFYFNLSRGGITRPGITAEEEKEEADREFTEDNPPEDDPDAVDGGGNVPPARRPQA